MTFSRVVCYLFSRPSEKVSGTGDLLARSEGRKQLPDKNLDFQVCILITMKKKKFRELMHRSILLFDHRRAVFPKESSCRNHISYWTVFALMKTVCLTYAGMGKLISSCANGKTTSPPLTASISECILQFSLQIVVPFCVAIILADDHFVPEMNKFCLSPSFICSNKSQTPIFTWY